MNSDLRALQAYVTAKDSQQYAQLAPGTVQLTVVHSHLAQQWPEIRIDLSTSVARLKERLYRHGGTPPEYQKLELVRPNGVVELSDDSRPLGFYSARSGMTLRIVDLNPHSLARGGGLEDVSLVQKYVMSEEDYAQREISARRFKQEMRQKDPKWSWGKPAGGGDPASVENLQVGARCEVGPGGRRGEIRYVGDAKGLLGPGVWVGVALDEPSGKNDGAVQATRFFTCERLHGVFAKPERVTVGDFPVDEAWKSEDEI